MRGLLLLVALGLALTGCIADEDPSEVADGQCEPGGFEEDDAMRRQHCPDELPIDEADAQP